MIWSLLNEGNERTFKKPCENVRLKAKVTINNVLL